MSTTAVPNFMVNPQPPAASDITTALNGKVSLIGNESITGNKQFSQLIVNNDGSWQNGFKWVISGLTSTEAPSATKYATINYYTENNVRTALIEHNVNSSDTSTIKLVAMGRTNTSTSAEMGIRVLSDNTKQTFAPTPDTSDNSTQIATTAFVNNRLPYESGTWTPTLSGTTTAGAFTYSYTNSGKGCYYVKLGNLVFLRAAFTYTVTTSPEGEVRVNGAPFVSNSYYSGPAGGNNRRYDSCQIPHNASYIRVRAFDSSTGRSPTINWGSSDGLGTWINTVNSNDWIIFSLWYMTNS